MSSLFLLGTLVPLLLGASGARAHDDDEAGDDLSAWVGPPAPVEGCEDRLQELGITFKSGRIPLHPSPRGSFTCGAEQVVRYVRGPGKIRYGASPKMSCTLALGMAELELIVQEEARRHLGRPIVRIEHAGTYNCREMAAYPGWVSEHSYANAIDIRSFIVRGGQEIRVSRHYGRGDSVPGTREGKFLRAVAGRLFREEVFSVVLTPNFDGAHRGHFHLDMARYRVDGT